MGALTVNHVCHTNLQMDSSQLETDIGTWYKSKERLHGRYPFGSPITTKNWYGNEVGIRGNSSGQ